MTEEKFVIFDRQLLHQYVQNDTKCWHNYYEDW